MWPGLALAPLGIPVCELRASAALQAALKLQEDLASQIPPGAQSGRAAFMRLLRPLQATGGGAYTFALLVFYF